MEAKKGNVNALVQYRLIDELKAINKQLKKEIEERKRYEAELLRAKKRSEVAAKVKTQFLANMSHEIRTPMNGIIGLSNLLLNTEPTGKQKEYLNAIATCSDSLLVIINDILDISKIEAGKMTFEKKNFRLVDVVSSVLDIFEGKAEEKKIAIKSNLDPNIPAVLTGDTVRLTQILYNLIGNAIKFTKQGEVVVNVNLDNSGPKNVRLSFSIIDTGIGIPKDKMNLIFNAFTQAKGQTTRNFGGTGLGLTIVRKLAELQGGTVEVQSELNVGSEFTVRLEFLKAKGVYGKKSNVPDAHEDQSKELPNLNGLSVLLVEDNPINQLVTDTLLSNMGVNVDISTNGQEAIECLKKKEYDLILMDIQMPVMDGYQAMKIIRTEFPYPVNHIPIIALTAHAMEG
ncbi:MAG: response regulator, partial [Crocinitomicaceae bacterium]|nr:response regulator [Crocinitomicaceae bacterium]